MSEILLECRNLTKSFGNKTVLNQINLKIPKGKITGLLGPNGSGKSTLIKLINGLLVPTSGDVTIKGHQPGVETKKIVSYLPERTYLNNWMRARQLVEYFADFYEDFDKVKAYDMLASLRINPNDKLATMSKGTKEKVQLILVMSRNADLYVLDEPIGGVDPAARDYILSTIISNYNPEASILLSTHLITDIENILDDIIFLQYGNIRMYAPVDEIRDREGKSIDTLFREVFRC